MDKYIRIRGEIILHLSALPYKYYSIAYVNRFCKNTISLDSYIRRWKAEWINDRLIL